MKVLRSKKGIPTCFINHPNGSGIVAECDIGVTGRQAMQAKLLVFKNPHALRQFWKCALGKIDLGKGCLGAVNTIGFEVYRFLKDGKERRHIQVDPRYFCIIGLTANNLNMEIVSHEAVHAAFAYAKRHRRDFWVDADKLDEETVCYPAGRIAASINRFLHEKGLYK